MLEASADWCNSTGPQLGVGCDRAAATRLQVGPERYQPSNPPAWCAWFPAQASHCCCPCSPLAALGGAALAQQPTPRWVGTTPAVQ